MGDKEQAPAKPSMGEPRQRNLKIWDRRTEALRASNSTPRNFTDEDPFYIEMPDEVAKKVRFLWISDIIMRKNPILTGWKISIYEPVTERIAEEMKIRVRTKTLTPDGAYRAGDAVLHWTPEEVAKEHDVLFLRGANPKEVARRASAAFEEQVGQAGGAAIGDITVSTDSKEIADAEQRQRSDVSSAEKAALGGY